MPYAEGGLASVARAAVRDGLGFDPKEPRSAADMRRSVCGGDGQLRVCAKPSFSPQCNRAPIRLARSRIPSNTQMAGARAFVRREVVRVFVRLVLFCLGLLETPPKVVKTAFTIDSSGNRTI